MRWKSFLRFFTRAWRQAKTPIRKRADARYWQLKFDLLEHREMLSGTPPTIVQAGVLPVIGSTTSATPTLQVEFSDSMTNSALNPSNYVLLGSTGILVPITNVSFVSGTSPSDDEVQLTYNSGNAGNALVVDTYNLYVRGNNLISASSGLAVSQPGQLFAANSGRNEVSVANIPGTSGLGASSNYSVPFTSPTPALADAVAFADVNGDGIPDLIVADGGSSEVNIFAGQSAAQGGGFNTTPTFTLSLPASTASAESIAVGDFNGATFPTGAPELDIAVATTNTDTVSVFLNSSSAVGVTSFSAGTSYSVDFDPVGITAGDFDGDGSIDLALAIDAATSAPVGSYRIDILPGSSTGTFGTVVQASIGDTTPSGLTVPSSIASGIFQAGTLPTLVVGGNDGLAVLQNTSTPGVFSFPTATVLSANPIVSVAVGSVSSGGENSIVDLTNANTLEIFQNDGSGGFAPVYTQALPSAAAGKLAIGNLNNGGDGDIVVTNAGATGSVTVVKNLTIGGTITSASRTTGNSIVVDAPGNHLVTGQFVTIAGNAFAAANVTDNAITVLGNSISSIVAVAGTVTVTTGTSGSLYGLVVGDSVTIAGTDVADGTFTLTNVNVAGNTFTFIDGTVTGNVTGTGNWTDPDKFILTGTSGAAGSGVGGAWARVGAITAASEAGGVAPIVVTSPANGLVSGDSVNIAGVPGFAAANGSFTITTLGSAITQANVATSGNVTITATSNYGLALGDSITISGNSLAVANGTWTITGIAGNTFTFSNPAATTVGATGNGGNWASPDKFTLNATNTTGLSTGAGGAWTTQTSFTTGTDVNFSTGTPITGTTTNGSASVSNLISTVGLSVGMAVIGTGIPTGATIASIVSNTSILLSANATAGGTPVLTFATSYATDADPIGVAVADTNGDGNLDIVTANDGASANDVTLLLGKGDGTLQAPANITVTSSNKLQNIVVADLNDDGIPDIIIANNANGEGSTRVTIYQGLGNGQYAAGISISGTTLGLENIVGIGVGHFSAANGSSANFPDLVFADGNANDDSVGFLQNKMTTAGATITPTSFAAAAPIFTFGDGFTSLAVGDFDNNGLDDVVVSYAGSGGFHGNPPGVTALINASSNANNFQFNENEYDTDAAAAISSVAVGDFNNDGNLDFVAAVNNAPGQIILNTGDGTGNFTESNPVATGIPNPVSVAVGDFNNDGYKDVVVGSSSTADTNSGIAVLLNQLGTGFGTPIVTAVAPGTPLNDVLVEDVNGDGAPDVVVSTAPLSGNVTGTSTTGSSPITINTNNVNGLTAGMTVTISGVQGDTAANGTWTIGAVNGGHAPNFTILGSTASANYTSGGTWVVGNTQDNVFLLVGNGTGAFGAPTPYLVGPTGSPLPAPTYLAITPTPLKVVTTFTSGGNLVQPNLLNNGNFDSIDLSGEVGNLLGWQTYSDPFGPGSAGAWVAQTGTVSPLSGNTVPPPSGTFQALLDEPNLIPIDPSGNNFNLPSSYFGSHVLYQDVTIPANAAIANFSMSLYIDNTGLGVGAFGAATPGTWSDPLASDPGGNSSLAFNTALTNQQVRVDIMAVNLVTGASDPSSGPIVITSPNNGLTNGQQVTITGVEGNTAANGTWFADVINANQFALYGNYNATTSAFSSPSAGNGIYTSGGEWTQNFLSVNNTGSGPDQVLEQLFQTYGASDPNVPTGVPFTTSLLTYSGVISANLAQFAGKTIRIRIASAANQGPLIISVDNAKLIVKFQDNTVPTLTDLAVNNPSFVSNSIPYTNDPTITGAIGAPYGLGNIAYVAFDPTNGNFTSSKVTKTTEWDATGNFSYTLVSATPGLNTIGVEVVDKAGNAYKTSFSFFLQTNSVTEWDPVGPQGIDVTGQGVNYTKISGRISATVADSLDPSGNTYLVGTPNGGIWRTTDGGNNWVAVTNNVTSGGTPVSVSVGALAQAPGNPNVMYAGTGVGDDQLDSLPGVGILKSTDDGLTWTLLAGSIAAFNGARVTAMVVDPNDPTGSIVFAAVASGGAGPGVYRSMDGGNTWTNISNPTSNMYTTVAPFLPGNGPLIGGAIGSVTSMAINPFNTFGELVIGIGDIQGPNISVGPSATGGVWRTVNAFTANAFNVSWAQIVGQNTAGVPNDTLPTGTGLGRVTVAVGSAISSDDKYLYVMIATTPVLIVPGFVDYGTLAGLYKSSDDGLDFTKVMLEQDVGTGIPNTATEYVFTPINLLGEDGANVGSLIIDPTDPNAVFVGGSSYWDNGDFLNHALTYVDTGNMLDYDTAINIGGVLVIPNNGDDYNKYAQALLQTGFYNPASSYGGTGLANDPYTGEGVYWYDMIEGQSGTDGFLDLLPGEITSMTVDSQGRFLVGTVGGIWRGINNGFSYDFTSGDTGILAGGGGHHHTPFSAPGMSFTSINGNLQISDMTSVAIDPGKDSTYYTTQVGTGVAGYTPATGWVSEGLTGPTTASGNNLDIPTAVSILTATTATGSVDLYRIWEYANSNALLPEVSYDGGSTWQSISAVPGGVTAGLVPAFAINPTVIYSGSPALPFNQLLFGSSDPVVTVDSSNTWNAIGTPAGIAAGALPSAAAIAPSNDETYYIGDDNGEVWATTSGGGGSGSWTLAAGAGAGLPAVSANSPVEGIAVNPANAANVFVMYGGSGSTTHVYKSTNTGVSFTAISGPWGSAQAYSMVIDPTVALGAPTGKIYLATQVGVYVSIDGGNSWSVLGLGMPNVPVVDLSFNSTLQTLAAATLGRGVFTINTAAISVIPTQTINENSTSTVIPFTVNDAGGASYTITATSSNPSLIANNGSGIVIGGSGASRTIQFTPSLNAYNTPVNGQGGPGVGNWQGPNSGPTAETITLTLSSGSYSFQQSFNVAVNFVNSPPTVTSPGNVTILPTASIPPLSIKVADAETPAGALLLQATSSNQALIPNSNLVFAGAASITAASWNAGSVTITAANTFSAGQQVVIAGVTPVGYNGAFTITSANANSFTYALAVNPGEPGGTTAITAATWAGNIATITASNTFSAGQTVVVTGMTPSGYNGTYTIASATGTQFTYALATSQVPATGFGAATVTGAPLGTATTGNRTLTITPLAVPITAATWSAGVATIFAGNAYSAGQTVVIAGVAPSGYDGTFIITSANATSFTYALASDPGGAGASFGTASLAGSAVITLTVTDGNGGTGQSTFNVLITSAVTLPFSDNFNSPPTSVFIGPGWNTNLGAISRVNGLVDATVAATANIATLNGLSQSNIALQADISVGPAGGQYAGLIARYSGVGDKNMYWAAIYSTGSGYVAYLEKNVGGAWNLIRSAAIPTSVTAMQIAGASWSGNIATITAANNFSAGQTVVIAGVTPSGYNGSYKILSANASSFTYSLTRDPGAGTVFGTASVTGVGTLFFDVTGSSLKVYYGPTGTVTPTLLIYAFDSSLASGTAGFRISGNANPTTTLDNFAAAAIPAPAALTLPFSDSFTTSGTLYTTPTSSNQLDASWLEGMGNFKDTGAGAAVGNTTSNSVATVSGVNSTDVSVSADVTLAVNQYVGLVARYTSAGNFYVARIQQLNATQIRATIMKYVGGNWATIPGASNLIISGVGANSPDSLTFQVEGPSLKLFLTNGAGTNLIAYADDFTLASGSVGIYAYSNASIANFNASAVTSGQTLSLAQPFADSFTPGTVANQLDTANWVELAGNFNVATGNAVSQIAGLNIASAVITAPVADVSVQATVSTSAVNQYAGLIARSSATTNSFYVGFIKQTTTVVNQATVPAVQAVIYKYVNGNPTLIGSSSVVPNTPIGAADNLVFQVEGPSLKLFLNGSLVAFASDTTLTLGSVGMYAYGAGVSFNGGATFTANVIASGAGLPFSDSFNESTPGYQLPTASWVEQAGNFSIASGNGAKPQGPNLNVAAVVLATPANGVSVQSSVTMSAIGQVAGLIARDSTATNSYYVGRIQQTTQGATPAVVAAIYKYVNGNATLIGTPQIIANANLAIGNSDALVFEANGVSLKLFVNGALAAYAVDATLTSGTVGIYTYGAANGVTINSGFSAYAIVPSQTLTFSDSFTSPTFASQLDPSSWVEAAGNFSTASGNSAVGQAAGYNVAFVTLANPAGDVSVNANVSLSAQNQIAGLTARTSATGNSYYVGRIQQISATSVQATIYKYVNGNPSQLGAAQTISTGVNMSTTANPTSDSLIFEAQGDSLKLFVNGSLATYAQDTSATALSTGSVGMYSYGAAGKTSFAGFSAGAIGSGTTLPYGPDPLNSSPFANQLDNSVWLEQAGNFNVTANGAVGRASVNLATLIDPNPTPANLGLNVAFSAANQIAGLVFGYTGVGDANYFYASVTSTSTPGAVQINLYQNVNGVLNKLVSTKSITGFGGNLDVTISGDVITVFTDGNQQLQVVDAAFTDIGLVGFRTNAGATASNFSAS